MEVLAVQNQYAEQCYADIGAATAKDWTRALGSGTEQPTRAPESSALDDNDAIAVNELSLRLLAELRAAKTRNLICTEVSLPTDLTTRMARDIVRVSEREPCGVRGCTVYVEYEEEPNNVRHMATVKVDEGMVSTFEVYLTLRQDKRSGWIARLPQFIKGLSRTVTISPVYALTKRKLYSSYDSQ